MNEILSKFKRLKVRCPNCGRRLQTTPSCEEWCEDCLWENGRKRGYCIVKFPELINWKGGRSSISKKDEDYDNILYRPIKFNELKYPIKSNENDILNNNVLFKEYNKLSFMAKALLGIILNSDKTKLKKMLELTKIQMSKHTTGGYNLAYNFFKLYFKKPIIDYKQGNKIFKELKKFIKKIQ